MILIVNYFFLEKEKEIEIHSSDPDSSDGEEDEQEVEEGEEGEGGEASEGEADEEGEELDDGYGSMELPDNDYEPPPKKRGVLPKGDTNNKRRGEKRPLKVRGDKAVKPAPPAALPAAAKKAGKKPAPPVAKAAKIGGGKKKGGAKKDEEEDDEKEWESKIETENGVVRDFSTPKKKISREKFNLG